MKKNTDRSRNKGRTGKMWAGAVFWQQDFCYAAVRRGNLLTRPGMWRVSWTPIIRGNMRNTRPFWKFPQRTRQRIWKESDEQIRTQLEGMDEITEEGREIYKDKLKEMEKLMHYEVGEAREQEDGSFVVPVTVEPADVYQTLEQHSYDVTLEMMERGEDPDAPEDSRRSWRRACKEPWTGLPTGSLWKSRSGCLRMEEGHTGSAMRICRRSQTP